MPLNVELLIIFNSCLPIRTCHAESCAKSGVKYNFLLMGEEDMCSSCTLSAVTINVLTKILDVYDYKRNMLWYVGGHARRDVFHRRYVF